MKSMLGDTESRPRRSRRSFFDPGSAFFRTSRASVTRYLVLGLTEAGRYLFVVLEPVSGRRAYVVTARDMTDGEKGRFKGRR